MPLVALVEKFAFAIWSDDENLAWISPVATNSEPFESIASAQMYFVLGSKKTLFWPSGVTLYTLPSGEVPT